MVRVGQRILTTSLRTAIVLQIESSCYLTLCEGKKKKIKFTDVFNVLEGPVKPETEDVPYTTIRVGVEDRRSRGATLSVGTEVQWEVVLKGATLEVNGIVLKSDPYTSTLSEWGVGVSERYWIVPTSILRPVFIKG